MADGACGVCGIAIAVSETLYTPDAKPVCQGCYNKQPAPRDTGTRSPAAIVLGIGAVIALVPFAIQSASYSYETANGEVVSSTYRDWFAIVGGVTAAGCALVAAVMALRLRAFALVGGAVLVVALGGYHIARGFGVFFKPDVRNADTQVGIEITRTPAPAAQPTDPATCADANACDHVGAVLGKKGDAAGALVAHTRACEFKQQYDCTRVGHAWLNGEDGAAKDPVKALKYLQRGCDLGDDDACTDAGVLYLTGQGTAVDAERGRKLLDKACDAKRLLGCKNLVNVYREGLGVTVDHAKAFTYATRACGDGGYEVADAPMIGWACDVAGLSLLNGEGTKKDPKAAIGYLEKGCERAASHCFNLAVVVADGNGTPKNEKLARELYAKACDADNLDACNNLGDMLNRGRGGKKDAAKAKELFKKACDGGVDLGCKNLK